MGGQSGGNAQILSLMSKYGGGGGGGSTRGTDMLTKAGLQASFNQFMHDRLGQGGFNGVFGFPEAMGNPRSGGNGGGGGGNKPPTTPTPADPTNTINWQFPQYTQTWAFTPPTPLPYVGPQPFDTSKYGNPYNKKDVKKNR